LSRLAGLLVLALGVQISLGISNVFHLPLLVAVAHNLGGAALLLTLIDQLSAAQRVTAGIPAADARWLYCVAEQITKQSRRDRMATLAREHQDHAAGATTWS
jgi:heme A synthase